MTLKKQSLKINVKDKRYDCSIVDNHNFRYKNQIEQSNS